MSLIPSESLNFPDHFRATIKPGAPKEKTSLLPQAQPKPVPQPVPVGPPKIRLVPRSKVRFYKPEPLEGSSNVGASHRDPQPSLMEGHGQKITTFAVAKSVEAAPPGTASPVASQAEPSGVSRMSTERRSLSPRLHGIARRPNKLLRFLLCEAVAISILLPLVMLGISGRFTDQTLILLLRILIVSAVAAVVIFPMVFFRRWENSRARER